MPSELLDRPPSLGDGVDKASEEGLRTFGAELIQRAGVLLRLPQITVASGAAILQRFYFRKSFAEFEVRAAAAAALALACKLEETHRKLPHVLVVFHRLHMREIHGEDGAPCFVGRPVPALDPNGKDFASLKRETLRAERHILRELGFEVAMLLDHPHKYVLRFVAALGCEGPSALAQRAWSYLNDSMRTTLCCRFQPEVIAAAGIYLGARSLGMKLPKVPPWWEPLGAELKEVQLAARAILSLYVKPCARHLAVPRRRREKEPPAEAAVPFAETPIALAASPASSDGEPEEALINEVGPAVVVQLVEGLDTGRLEDKGEKEKLRDRDRSSWKDREVENVQRGSRPSDRAKKRHARTSSSSSSSPAKKKTRRRKAKA